MSTNPEDYRFHLVRDAVGEDGPELLPDLTDAEHGEQVHAHIDSTSQRCLCDGGSYEVKAHPFLVHPDCPIHGGAR